MSDSACPVSMAYCNRPECRHDGCAYIGNWPPPVVERAIGDGHHDTPRPTDTEASGPNNAAS